jgi:hypothetical protein
MHDASAIVPENNKAVQQPEGDCRDDEEVHRRQAAEVILQEGLPGLRRRLALPGHVFGQGGLGDVVAQEVQFGLNAGRAPQWVLLRDPFDERNDFAWDGGPARLASARLPAPEQPEAGPVPADHRVRLHNRQPVPPAREQARAPHPEQPVAPAQLRLGLFAQQNSKLLA